VKSQATQRKAEMYHAGNLESARIIAADPGRYPGIMQEWARLVLNPPAEGRGASRQESSVTCEPRCFVCSLPASRAAAVGRAIISGRQPLAKIAVRAGCSSMALIRYRDRHMEKCIQR
jgi:hypothetical protein